MIWSLGHDAPSCLPPQRDALRSRAHRLVTLFSLVCRAVHWPFMVRGAREALAGDQREAAGILPTIPGKLADYRRFLSGHTQSRETSFPPGGHVIPTLLWQNPQILPLKIASSPPPRVQSAIQRGPGIEAPLVPIRLCPRKKGSCVPKLRVPAALEQWGQASRCRSVLGGWCS